MIKITDELIKELSEYSNPNTKIARMVEKKELVKIKKGFYETDNKVNPFYLTGIIYGPSYISFQTALYYYGMIPERVYQITCATSNKHKSKLYQNYFGSFSYKDIPQAVYPFGIERVVVDNYCYYIASKEKALCDMLYEYSPVSSIKEIESILFDDLRIELDVFKSLDMKLIQDLSELYKTTNHKLLINLTRRKYYAK